eukprot:9149233-Pyramimonas_sp.AAC.1
MQGRQITSADHLFAAHVSASRASRRRLRSRASVLPTTPALAFWLPEQLLVVGQAFGRCPLPALPQATG